MCMRSAVDAPLDDIIPDSRYTFPISALTLVVFVSFAFWHVFSLVYEYTVQDDVHSLPLTCYDTDHNIAVLCLFTRRELVSPGRIPVDYTVRRISHLPSCITNGLRV